MQPIQGPGAAWDLFNPLCPINGGQLATYRYASETPFNLDAGLDYGRPATGVAHYPFPLMIGGEQFNTLPLFDTMEYQLWFGKMPFGPYINTQSLAMTDIFPNIQGGIAKVTG